MRRAYFGVTEAGEVQAEAEGQTSVQLAEAAPHVLLEALHMDCQQRRTPERTQPAIT